MAFHRTQGILAQPSLMTFSFTVQPADTHMNHNVSTEVSVTSALEVNVRDEYEDNTPSADDATVSHTADECAWND